MFFLNPAPTSAADKLGDAATKEPATMVPFDGILDDDEE